jgi:uncharacterized protein YcbX
MNDQLTLSEIFIYPIKSLSGISLQKSTVEESGLKYDRRMMLVDETGVFFTQRDFPQMALLKTRLVNDGLVITDQRNGSVLKIFHDQNTKEKINVVIWDDNCVAVKVLPEADQFFSDALGIKCFLVLLPKNEKREVDKPRKYVNDYHLVGFADGYPFLIIGQSSLDDLNSKLVEPLPINRFRPNFVFTNGEPYEEDQWKDFLIGGGLRFKAVKPCARCVITTTNQDTAERKEEPLKTLSTYRRIGNGVMFGMNLVCESTGEVYVGDKISLINN